ncbi:uncharacterized protein N7458_002361 [Penicillium daleae]|uniref:Zn(2)-C6 fungal-type domain-containing protein n=1 Tax=Penicillium daleae TaxID=63821 RepID=A0AAD6G5T9_9EURO|nr:uncharacterized protein N7458_002361 [Penicillium daleae]KAJ5460809.1 hypothetical protein N7458_002361 [Penicillium daleae]
MGDVGRAFRPIAPRTMPPDGGAGGQPPLGNSGGGPSEDGRMKRASTACKECQKRRTRCTGPPKCSECDTHDRECTFDEQADRRRKANARRTQEELASLSEFTEQLLSVIRYSNNATTQHVVNVIRSSTSREEIQSVLISILAQNPELAQQALGQPAPPPHPQQHPSAVPPHHVPSDLDPHSLGPYFDPR